jgi:hypothetical protein
MSSKSVLKQALVSGVFAGLALANAEAQASDPKATKGSVQCFGVNSCKGQNGCTVTTAHIKAANEAFANKYANSKTMECAGNVECAASKGHLAFVSKPSAKECFGKGGFLFEKTGDKLTVKKS